MLSAKITPQALIVMLHLALEGSITNMEAHTVLKVRSVSSRISELQKVGVRIKKEYRTDSVGQRYVRYILDSPITVAK